jgi:hypothetical protein
MRLRRIASASERWLPYDGVNCLRKYTALKCKIFTTTRACNRFSPIAVDNNQTNRTVRTVICGKYLPAHREVCSRSNRSHEDRSCRSTRLCVSRRVLFIAAADDHDFARTRPLTAEKSGGGSIGGSGGTGLIGTTNRTGGNGAPHQSDPLLPLSSAAKIFLLGGLLKISRFKKCLIYWRSLGGSNPCFRRERGIRAEGLFCGANRPTLTTSKMCSSNWMRILGRMGSLCPQMGAS